VRRVRQEIESWMQEHEWNSLNEMRGNMSFDKIPDPAAYERANFRMSLR
jgi:dihydroorotate dehydrogenase (fumarate)